MKKLLCITMAALMLFAIGCSGAPQAETAQAGQTAAAEKETPAEEVQSEWSDSFIEERAQAEQMEQQAETGLEATEEQPQDTEATEETEPEAAEEQPEETEEPAEEEESGSDRPLSGLVIGVDPGHQAQGNSDQEPVAPGSGETKAKVSSGTAGVDSGVMEHVVNLNVGMKLRDLLEDAGATVIMTRESADVDISNVERAQMFNDYEVDLGIRLHCDGVEGDSSVTGAFMLIPEESDYPDTCRSAAEAVINAYCEETGIRNAGITVRGDQTGFNWCERPIINIEMGRMSNPGEDAKLTDTDFQVDMAYGIYNGLMAYFS